VWCSAFWSNQQLIKPLPFAGQSRHGLAKRNYALVTLLLESGLRASEVCPLRLGDLNLRERSGRLQVRERKGRKQREVPLNSSARRALRLHLAERQNAKPEDHVFLSERGGKPCGVAHGRGHDRPTRSTRAHPAAGGYSAPDAAHLCATVFKAQSWPIGRTGSAAGTRIAGHNCSLHAAHRGATGGQRRKGATLMSAPAPAVRQRRSGVLLPQDPSDDELARHWTLSESDKRSLAVPRRGKPATLRPAIVCAALVWTVLEVEETAPVRIVNWARSSSCHRSYLAAEPVALQRKRSTRSRYADTSASSAFIAICNARSRTGCATAFSKGYRSRK
jgi:hypothetical protein